mmetsp:Transcript_25000/g.54959  ORF Transcript_25000/g.54959 Transcript_25000/m.54959 type:complete len:240 (-) Transcript_25000:720-1439(-)
MLPGSFVRMTLQWRRASLHRLSFRFTMPRFSSAALLRSRALVFSSLSFMLSVCSTALFTPLYLCSASSRRPFLKNSPPMSFFFWAISTLSVSERSHLSGALSKSTHSMVYTTSPQSETPSSSDAYMDGSEQRNSPTSPFFSFSAAASIRSLCLPKPTTKDSSRSDTMFSPLALATDTRMVALQNSSGVLKPWPSFIFFFIKLLSSVNEQSSMVRVTFRVNSYTTVAPPGTLPSKPPASP